jgi:hypothetical protein
MAQTINQPEADYAGFLNGYIAGNLDANAPELQLHADRIFQFLKDLQSDIASWNLVKEQNDEFIAAFAFLNSTSHKPSTVADYLDLGNSIFDIITLVKKYKSNPPSTSNFHLKKIIYHYLNIAKTAKDTDVINKAKKIVEIFEIGADKS